MDFQKLVPLRVDLSRFHMGSPQKSGSMSVVPIFGPDLNGKYNSPLSDLKLAQVKGYGNMELLNPSSRGVAIVPLHMGYIQDQAQNHALCRSAFIGAGQRLMFEDACCVQQAQGGYLEGREQWFFILPLQLREEALKLRGQKDYSKLWSAIATLNEAFGLEDRGHLEQIVSRQRPYLNQFQSRFELLPNQTGALFFIEDRLAGVEIAPSAAYFQEVWMPLVCFCYGTAAMQQEKKNGPAETLVVPFSATHISELRTELQKSRTEWQEHLKDGMAQIPSEAFEKLEEERFLELRLYTLIGNNFAGQCVEEDGHLIYASLFAKGGFLS